MREGLRHGLARACITVTALAATSVGVRYTQPDTAARAVVLLPLLVALLALRGWAHGSLGRDA